MKWGFKFSKAEKIELLLLRARLTKWFDVLHGGCNLRELRIEILWLLSFHSDPLPKRKKKKQLLLACILVVGIEAFNKFSFKFWISSARGLNWILFNTEVNSSEMVFWGYSLGNLCFQVFRFTKAILCLSFNALVCIIVDPQMLVWTPEITKCFNN